jgi:GH18 family chitinase
MVAALVGACQRGWSQEVASPVAEEHRLVGYLPNYEGSYAHFAKTLDFTKMTHLNLIPALPPKCHGRCTADSDMTFSLGQSDADIDALVTAAHNAGVKVLVTICNSDNNNYPVLSQFYNAGLSSELAASLDSFVTAHDLDGVDVDVETPTEMGDPYDTFMAALIANLHPEGKILSAAVAEWVQSQNVMTLATLHAFDFLNVMVYSNLSEAKAGMAYFSSLDEPASQMTLGVPFFGCNAAGSICENYATILAAYPNAWKMNEVRGGKLDGGVALYYVGEPTMAKETKLGMQYGGVMIWELAQDASGRHSLLTVIRNTL